MSKYKKIKINRLYDNLASVRDYIWEECVQNDMGIIFECNNANFVVEPWEVKNATPGENTYTSKFDGRKYRLVDFPWQTTSRQEKLL